MSETLWHWYYIKAHSVPPPASHIPAGTKVHYTETSLAATAYLSCVQDPHYNTILL